MKVLLQKISVDQPPSAMSGKLASILIDVSLHKDSILSSTVDTQVEADRVVDDLVQRIEQQCAANAAQENAIMAALQAPDA